jgi:two-component system sensor histidine kinase NreB
MNVELTGTPATRDRVLGLPGLELVVRDAGTGFDPASLSESAGLGLAGIREQAEMLGGSFTLRTAPGTGTELRVRWPLGPGPRDA